MVRICNERIGCYEKEISKINNKLYDYMLYCN